MRCHGRLLFLDAAHVSPTRSQSQAAGQFGKLFRRTRGVDLNTAVVQIARVACEVQFAGGALNKVAVANALNASAHEPAPRLDPLLFHSATIEGPLHSGQPDESDS